MGVWPPPPSFATAGQTGSRGPGTVLARTVYTPAGATTFSTVSNVFANISTANLSHLHGTLQWQR